ncbi:MAG: phosphoenolpyruvate--protein phosphotransferase [Alphaproteobacteria bacterium]
MTGGSSRPLKDFSRLLRKLRETMSFGEPSPKENLNKIIDMLAAEMKADICSVYIRSSSDFLVLFSTNGAQPKDIMGRRAKIGESLVGDVAKNGRPLVLSDATKRLEEISSHVIGTAEEFKGFLAVPLNRGGHVVGVLTLKNYEKRAFSHEEVEIIQTVSVIISEMIFREDIIPVDSMIPEEGTAWLPLTLSGVSLNAGLSYGTAVLHQPILGITRRKSDDASKERRRLQKAVTEMQVSLEGILKDVSLSLSRDQEDILEVYRMLAYDQGWLNRINKAIERGLSAEAAIEKVLDDLKKVMLRNKDSFWEARITDFEDLSRRLISCLSGPANDDEAFDPSQKIILIAQNMGPAELLDYDHQRIGGLILEEGQHTSHVAIVARTIGVPVVSRVGGAMLRIEPGDPIIINGDSGQIMVRPGKDALATFEHTCEVRKRHMQKIEKAEKLPAITRDGVEIDISLNAGLPLDLENIDNLNCNGVGLYRTEIPFMLESSLPDIDEQRRLYEGIIDLAGDKPVTFRTLDIGGDKILPYLDCPRGENPAMGWRAVRMSLDRPGLFRHQIRALIRASKGKTLRVMVPLVAEVSEFRAAKDIILLEMDRAKAKDEPVPSGLRVGAMFEVPSLLYQLDELSKYADFISIGTNDLFQFFYAVDRNNPFASERFKTLSQPFLRFLQDIASTCNSIGLPHHICGELAGSPIAALALIGIGYRSLSVAPPSVGHVKLAVQNLNLESFEMFIRQLLERPCGDIHHEIESYTRDHGIY